MRSTIITLLTTLVCAAPVAAQNRPIEAGIDAGVIAVFIPIAAVIGGFVLVVLKGWPGGDNERLTEAVQQLQDEVAELQERADFTERVLSEVRARNVISPGDST